MHMIWLVLGGLLCPLQLSPGSFPQPLKPEEERIYLQRAAEGDIEARNVLVERNLRLVAHIMKKYYASESDQEDLISIGTIGLIKAVSTYKMDKNIRLATYASRCIENATLLPATFTAGRRCRWAAAGSSEEMPGANMQGQGIKTGNGLHQVCSLRFLLAVSTTASSNSSFCFVGQFSAFRRCVTALA